MSCRKALLIVYAATASVALPFCLAATPSNAAAFQDPAALALLTRVMAATGWDTLEASLADITVISTTTGASPGNTVTLKARPAEHEFRFDLQGGLSQIRSGSTLRTISSTQTTFFPSPVATASFPFYLPFATPLISYTDPTVPVRLLGTQTFDGQQVEAIEFGLSTKHGNLALPGHGTAIHLIAFIDPSSNLPTGAILDWPERSRPSVSLPLTWHWSDYQKFGGVLLPSTVTETLGSTTLQSATITSAQLNTGLTDANF
jgi:hypothetical protein